MSFVGNLKKHAILSAIGLVLGLIALAWVQPLTPAGATLVLLVVVAVINAVAAIVPSRTKNDNGNSEAKS